MSFILALIICLGVWFFMIAPFLRLWRASKQWRDLYTAATGNDPRRQQRRRQQPQPEPKKKKKIDPSVGEYVEFTETQTTTSQTDPDGTTRQHTESESQITDITWEDLPPKKD